MFRLATNLAFPPAGIYRHPPQVHYACRAISTTPQKMRITNLKYQTAYSKVTMTEAQQRLGFTFRQFESHSMPVSQMLAHIKPEIDGLGKDQVQKTKEKVFDNIVEFIEGECYPTESNEDFKEANVNDLVLLIILPILTAFRRETGCDLCLQREKEIIAVDSETGGYQEFVVMDFIGLVDQKFVFVVEAMKSSVGQAKRQCLLAMKDMGDNNGGGVVHGFVTTGDQWQMIRYDGTAFTQTEHFQVMFPTMGREKGRWMKEASIIVDSIHAALRSGVFLAGN
ncbi:unnamed protein product [Tuber aestivum]|uniref:Uncharacterized protein n=1 Tax=Tuber aestivum TaxID=59557 RepID=A0A292PK66_9PEZI|nr:unnamed protein product [Tuber aestivum]